LNPKRIGRCGSLVLCVVCLVACQQEMANQPKNKPYSSSAFFDDGRAARPRVEGTVARGQLDIDEHLYTGKIDGKLATTLPFPLTRQLLARGRERFNIYCTPCHDAIGTGQGMVVRRGFRRPPSYHIDRLRQAPIGHFFDVMTHGFGAMSDYAAQVPPNDRWAIAAYIRALQLSQHATLAEVPADRRRQLQERTP
jgi:hypothetical protein